ncbi:MAG: NAD-dependent epimerase/dehydratase family protein [Kiritimatiellae bacterium]|nr:NAD-dependent epimerase/dehydratase family protein [Kiritimatiellia bacterium]
MKSFITGGAGFIGSHVADRLLASGFDVVIYDNFSTGKERFLENALSSSHCTLVWGDTRDVSHLTSAMKGADIIFHFAANADVRLGTQHPRKDLEQNTIATFNVLEAMRTHDIQKIVFSSTGSIYGEPDVFPTPENAPFPIQTSLYGASKSACEGMIAAYCEGFNVQAYIFRFVSILGERYSHGHVFDFYKKLQANPHKLEVLGSGHQKKSYLYVQDCIDAMLLALKKSKNKVNIYNLGTNKYCEVNQSIQWICKHLNVSPKLMYTGGERGWIGDSPFIFLDTRAIESLGWTPKRSIQEGVIRTVSYLQATPWLMESRS